MLFKSEAELKKYILSRCRKSIVEVEKKIYGIIDSYLKKYYSEFSPKEYIRTEQLLRSLVRTGVKQVGSSFVAEVYFDASALNYEQGMMPLQHTPEHGMYGWATWTGDKVLETAMHGSHGGYKMGTAIWDKSLTEIGDGHVLLIQALKANGIPIK